MTDLLSYEPPICTDALPIVDLAASFSASEDARRAVAREIRAAVCDTGFFYVKHHGVDAAVVAGAFEQAQRFLRLPLAEKERCARADGLRGYEGLASQATGVYTLTGGAAAVGDLKDLFNFGYGRGPDVPDTLDNQWPEGVPGFREALDAYYAALEGLGKHLIRLLALSLDLPEDFFDDGFRLADANCRVLRYPPQTNALPGQMGAGAHTDIGAITILAQDHHEALEVRTRAGDWIRATPIPGTFVINIGDLMMRWTNDVYQSSMHRVMNNTSDEERFSIVYFFGPRYDTRVECVPTCTSDDRPPKYEPCLSGDYRKARLAMSYNF